MPILVKRDDVRSGRKAKAHHGRHRRQWVNKYTSNCCSCPMKQSTSVQCSFTHCWTSEIIKNVVYYMYLKKFPSYSRKVKYRFLKNSSYLFFTSCFLGEFQWITCELLKKIDLLHIKIMTVTKLSNSLVCWTHVSPGLSQQHNKMPAVTSHMDWNTVP